MARRRRINPIPVLVVLALIPAAGLAAFWRFARCSPSAAGRPARCARSGEPAAAMTTQVLSVRRNAECCRDRSTSTALQAALQPLLASVDDNRCFALAIDSQLWRPRTRRFRLHPPATSRSSPPPSRSTCSHRFTTPPRWSVRSALMAWSKGDLSRRRRRSVLASQWWNGNNEVAPFNETSFESLADVIQQVGVKKITAIWS